MSRAIYIKSRITKAPGNFAGWPKNILLGFLVFGVLLEGVSGPTQVEALDGNHEIAEPGKPRKQTSPKSKDKTKKAFDFGSPPKAKIRLTPKLSMGARFGLEYQLEDNFDLDSSDPDDVGVFKPSVSLTFSYDLIESISFFANLKPSGRIVDDEENKKKNKGQLSLSQAFVSWDTPIQGLRVTGGRQRIRDRRQWVYDDQFDAFRLNYGTPGFGLDISIGALNQQDLLNDEKDPEAGLNFAAFARWKLGKDHEVAVYNFVRDDKSSRRESPVFFGLQMSGEPLKDTEYWVEFAHVRGRSGSVKIRGYGFDAGFTSVFDTPWKPAITLGTAYGSGDDNPADNIDHNFRQTGLQDNNAAFNGVTRLQYYGELVDPELSNLTIFTGGLGIRPIRKTSLDFVYHYYRQNEQIRKMRGLEIDAKTNGLSKDLGHEVDLIVGYRNKKTGLTASFILGYFIPGSAFANAVDKALFLETKIRYDF